MPRIPAVTSEVSPPSLGAGQVSQCANWKVIIMSVNENNLEIGFEQDMPIIAAAGERHVIPMPAFSPPHFARGRDGPWCKPAAGWKG